MWDVMLVSSLLKKNIISINIFGLLYVSTINTMQKTEKISKILHNYGKPIYTHIKCARVLTLSNGYMATDVVNTN